MMGKKALSILLAGNMLLGGIAASATAMPVYAAKKVEKDAEASEPGKYISDVYIAYGKTQEEAIKWLKAHDWEPISGNNNFDSGKNAGRDRAIVAAMGIRRTNDAKEAIKDMAVMNMKGEFSIPDYEDLVKDKRAEIDEFIYKFLPAIEEYRENFFNEDSAGHSRALLANEMMNKLYDGGEEERYAANDTAEPIGDLLLEKLVQEDPDEGLGDLEQIILESTKPAVMAIETAIALAADTAEDTWLDRLTLLTEEELEKDIALYIPETEDQDIAPSAVMQFYQQVYGDAADAICKQWEDVHDSMLFVEKYQKDNDLLMHEKESEEDYVARYEAAMDALKKAADADKAESGADLDKYLETKDMYIGLYSVDYPGEWGETLGDFFNPAGDKDYSDDINYYLPMAVALSEGQRSSLDLISLKSLLTLGLSTEDGIENLLPDLEDMLDGMDQISVYSGSNRGIFRGGVALTSETLMQTQHGDDPFGEGDVGGAISVIFYTSLILGGAFAATGAGFLTRALLRENPVRNMPRGMFLDEVGNLPRTPQMVDLEKTMDQFQTGIKDMDKFFADNKKYMSLSERVGFQRDITRKYGELEGLKQQMQRLESAQADEYVAQRTEMMRQDYEMRQASDIKIGTVLAAIGVVLIIAGIVTNSIALYNQQKQYFDRTFCTIPRMIVDKDDIVSYVENKNGELQRSIDFDQFKYYEAVRCNRQEVGKISKWQKGVEDYLKDGCGDVADLNADHGKEWLALYTCRSNEKGHPILADSLMLQLGGSNKPPKGTSKVMHYFNNFGSANLADTAYCFESRDGSMYFFWDEDTKA